MTGLPSGPVTFLFTDHEGSTRPWQERPEGDEGSVVRTKGPSAKRAPSTAASRSLTGQERVAQVGGSAIRSLRHEGEVDPVGWTPWSSTGSI